MYYKINIFIVILWLDRRVKDGCWKMKCDGWSVRGDLRETKNKYSFEHFPWVCFAFHPSPWGGWGLDSLWTAFKIKCMRNLKNSMWGKFQHSLILRWTFSKFRNWYGFEMEAREWIKWLWKTVSSQENPSDITDKIWLWISVHFAPFLRTFWYLG